MKFFLNSRFLKISFNRLNNYINRENLRAQVFCTILSVMNKYTPTIS
jgi:hypothetical protein